MPPRTGKYGMLQVVQLGTISNEASVAAPKRRSVFANFMRSLQIINPSAARVSDNAHCEVTIRSHFCDRMTIKFSYLGVPGDAKDVSQ